VSGGHAAPLRWVEVNPDAITHNTSAVLSWLRPPTQLMAMVKSDAYGHGAVCTAHAALRGGAGWLGVYTPDEALQLRAAGIDAPLLVAGHSPAPTLPALVESRVDVTVYDDVAVRALAACGSPQAMAHCHIKVDTGLGRLGVSPSALPQLLETLHEVRDRVEVAGVFTHFADTDSGSAYTAQQDALLRDAATLVHKQAPGALVHAAGSAAIIGRPETHHDLVRAGITLYGYVPNGLQAPSPLRIAMTACALVVQVKWIEAGASVGYGRTWRAEAPRRIATVAMGYAQGLARSLSNRGAMLLRGRRCPIVGTVSMDQVTLDVTDVAGVEQGDVAVYFGEREGARLDAAEVARLMETVPYEVLCRTGASVPARIESTASTAIP
jgi:alanine racemase